MKLVLLTGLPGSGKSLVAKLLSEYLRAPTVNMGDVVREEARRRGLPESREVLSNIAIELRKNYGSDAIAKLTYEYWLRKLEGRAEVVIVDGVRSWDEVNYFKQRFGDVLVVAVHASPRTRFRRLRERGRSDDPRSWIEFVKRDLAELSMGVGTVIALADYVITNEKNSLTELESKVRELAELIKHES
ncbi:MAG: dephospho-CoA kinase [Thermoprotei archaeon]|nr:MAG: dephospho-CoA kinase [Thermoprotei archaeon]